MQTETTKPIHYEIHDGIEGNIDLKAHSCADLFLLRDDGSSVTDDMRDAVYKHFKNDIQTMTGLSSEDADKLARSKLAEALSSYPIEQTIFAPVPVINTEAITAIQQGRSEKSRLTLERVKRFFLHTTGTERPN